MKRLFISTLFIAVTLIGYGQAQDMLVPGDLRQETIITEPASLHKGFLRVGLVTSFGFADRYFNSEGEKVYIPESAWARASTQTIFAQYGVTDRLQVELFIPRESETRNYSAEYIDAALGSYNTSQWDLTGSGLGDIYLTLLYQFITESGSRPSVTGWVDLTLPTGEKNPTNISGPYDYDLPTGYGAINISSRLRVRKVVYPFSYTGYINYVYNFAGEKMFSAADPTELEFRYGNRIDIGGSANFHLNDWIAVANELNYFHTGKGEQEGVDQADLTESSAFSYEARLVFQIRRVRFAEAVRVPLAGKNVSADPLYVVMVQLLF